MVTLKFAAVFCLVYFTIFMSARKTEAFCQNVSEKLESIKNVCQDAASDQQLQTLEMNLEEQLKNIYSLVENISISLPPVTGSSCKELYYKGLRENKAYWLTTESGGIPVYCQMTNDLGECGAGGWTMVMKIDGSKQTFRYHADIWKNKDDFNLPGGETGFDSQETKLPTYWETPFSRICLGMKYGHQIRYIAINKRAESLYSLIADGQHRATSLSREKWKSLIGPDASLQTHCNVQGFNAQSSFSYYSKARIGIIASQYQEQECFFCQSRIGFGTEGIPDDSNTCGNAAIHSPDNGDQHIKAFGYILVR